MNINNALDAALTQVAADKKTISDDAATIATLTAAANNASANAANIPDPVKTKALVDAVLGADSATLP